LNRSSSAEQSQQVQPIDHYAPKNSLERIVYWLTRAGWSIETVVKVGAVAVALSGPAFSMFFVATFSLLLLFGVVEVRIKWGQPALDLSDSQYERLSEETATLLWEQGWRPPSK
jgi:hypothetical protein